MLNFKFFKHFHIEMIAVLSVVTSFSAPLFSEVDPCLLCKIQRFGWLFAFVFSFSSRLGSRFTWALTWLARVGFIVIFVVATLQMLVHIKMIPDLCHLPRQSFPSMGAYLAYLESHPPCDESILKILGIPAYILSLIGAVACLFSSFKLNKTNPLTNKENLSCVH